MPNAVARLARTSALAVTLLCLQTTSTRAADQPVFVWRASNAGETVWLAGSIHLGKADFYPLPEAFDRGFQLAEHLAVEVRPDGNGKATATRLLAEKSALDPRTPLPDILPPDVFGALQQWMAARNVPAIAFADKEPWFISMSISLMDWQSRGYSPQWGVERHFLSRADARGMTVHELETIDFQYSIFDDMPISEQALLLEQSLSDSSEIDEITTQMINAWKSGNGTLIAEISTKPIADRPGLAPLLDRLLTQRNRSLATSAQQLAAQLDGSIFVLVGAAHLPGTDGMVELFRQDGWTVQQLGGAAESNQ